MAAYMNIDFKPTPMIFGEEGKCFLESTVNVQKESKKHLSEMKIACEQFNEALKKRVRWWV